MGKLGRIFRVQCRSYSNTVGTIAPMRSLSRRSSQFLAALQRPFARRSATKGEGLGLNAGVFSEFPRWRGYVGPALAADFVGHLTSGRHNLGISHWPGGECAPDYPQPDEEIFEWVAMLEAVLAAGSSFTMVELGAGYGRWIARAGCALRLIKPETKLRLIGVEAEHNHFAFMQQHLALNGVPIACCTLICAPVDGVAGDVLFTIGHPVEWYGQAIVPANSTFGDWPEAKVVPMRSVTIPQVLAPLEFVDLIDMDIQGAELSCIANSLDVLRRKAARLLIGTHGNYIHRKIYRLLDDDGWCCKVDYGGQAQHETEFGTIQFGDGVQYWVNPRLVR